MGSALKYKASLPVSAIVAATFGLYLAVGFELALQFSALISLSLSLGITLILPTIALGLALVAVLTAQFTLALGLSLPSFNANLALSLNFELGIVLGLLATLKGILSAVATASLIAYGYTGTGADLGPQLQGAIGGGWPDGTAITEDITAFVFVATTSGSLTKQQVDSVALLAPPATPPTPPAPSPPPGSFPPPQAYERGLASVSFPSQVYPTLVYPADPATGTVTITDGALTGIGAITAINVTHSGSGYTGPATCLISDTVTMVSASLTDPILVTLPNPLSIPIGNGIGVTIQGVQGDTTIVNATNTTPIVISVATTTNLKSCTITGATGNLAANGQWYCKTLSPTAASLWQDATFTIPSSGTGQYNAGSATLCGNINGLQFAAVGPTLFTTLQLYQDQDLTIPLPSYGTYTGGQVTGGGTGAAGVVTMGGGAQASMSSFFNGLIFPEHGGLSGGTITFELMCGLTFQCLLDLLGNLESRASILASATASASLAVLPPSVSASIELLAKMTATLKANLTAKLPSISITASASAALSAQLAIIGKLSGEIGAQLGLAAAGIVFEVYEYSGPGSGLAEAISTGPGHDGWHDATDPTASIAACVFGLTNPASALAFSTFFVGV